MGRTVSGRPTLGSEIGGRRGPGGVGAGRPGALLPGSNPTDIRPPRISQFTGNTIPGSNVVADQVRGVGLNQQIVDAGVQGQALPGLGGVPTIGDAVGFANDRLQFNRDANLAANTNFQPFRPFPGTADPNFVAPGTAGPVFPTSIPSDSVLQSAPAPVPGGPFGVVPPVGAAEASTGDILRGTIDQGQRIAAGRQALLQAFQNGQLSLGQVQALNDQLTRGQA